MKYLRCAAGLLILAACFSGYYLAVIRTVRIKKAFAPAFLCSSAGLVMYTAGLLNILPEAAAVIAAGGCLLLLRELRRSGLHHRIPPEVLFFSAGVLILLAVCRFSYIYQWDNFSHWTMIVKLMLSENRLPNFQDTMIVFPSYPAGSASFIYFVCRIAGTSEHLMVFAQDFLILSALVSMYGVIREKSRQSAAAVTVAVIFVFCYNTEVNGLMVDTLLTSLGIAGALILYTYRSDLRSGMLYSMPVLCFAASVKSSGMFFVLVCWCLMLHCCRNVPQTVRKGLSRVITAYFFCPAFCLYLWGRHVKLVFSSAAENSLHSVSVSNYMSVVTAKTSGDIRTICMLFLNKMVPWHNLEMTVLILLICLYLVFCLRSGDRNRISGARKLLLYTLAAYIVYQVFLLATYLFSMPVGEALKLSAYGRYHKMAFLFFAAMAVSFFVSREADMLRKKSGIVFAGVFASACAAVLLLYSFQTGSAYRGEKEERQALEAVITEYGIPQGSSYIIYTEKANNGYYYFLSRYEFMSDKVLLLNKDTAAGADSGSYDYVLIPEQKAPGTETEKLLDSYGRVCRLGGK